MQISDTEYGATSCQRKEQNPQNNPQHPLSNQMIEQINIALEQKGSRNFSTWVIEACRRRLTSEKYIHQLKVMKNEHPAFFPRTGRYCKFT